MSECPKMYSVASSKSVLRQTPGGIRTISKRRLGASLQRREHSQLNPRFYSASTTPREPFNTSQQGHGNTRDRIKGSRQVDSIHPVRILRDTKEQEGEVIIRHTQSGILCSVAVSTPPKQKKTFMSHELCQFVQNAAHNTTHFRTNTEVSLKVAYWHSVNLAGILWVSIVNKNPAVFCVPFRFIWSELDFKLKTNTLCQLGIPVFSK